MAGDDVKPIVHGRYDGRDLVLPDHPSAVLRTADDPPLASCIGDDIVTASGLTLLGADDKAGVAEIMAAAEYLMAHQEIPHGPVRIAFTPDEEIGRGTAHFDVARFDALCAYTLDGGGRGELEVENFSADAMTFAFQGFNTHPGYARGRMVNAIKEFQKSRGGKQTGDEVHLDAHESGQFGGCDRLESGEREARHDETERTAGEPDEERFDERLERERAAAGAERGAHRHLAVARHRAHQPQVGQVGAGD